MIVPRKHGDTRSLLRGDPKRMQETVEKPFNSNGRVHFLGWSSIQKDRVSGFFVLICFVLKPANLPIS